MPAFRPLPRLPHLSRLALPLLLIALLALGAPLPTLAQAPPELAGTEKGPIEFSSGGEDSIFAVWRALADAQGLEVVFDNRTKDSRLAIELTSPTLGGALDRLALVAGQFWTPIDAHTILVADDTPQNRRQYEPQVVRTFRLENMEVKDAMTVLRSIYGLKHVSAQEDRNSITLRDVHAKGMLAERLLERIDVPEDEVAIHVELITLPEQRWKALSSRATTPGQLAELVARGQVRSVLRSDLGIVGSRRAAIEAKERNAETGDLLALTVELAAKVHPQSEEITLGLESRLVQLDPEALPSEQKGLSPSESQGTQSSWRVPAGEVLLVELPGTLGKGSDVLALALTPTIRRIGSRGATEALWIGTESTFQAPSTASSNAPLHRPGDDRDAVQARLREGLVALEARADNGS